ncbi:MAG: segregation/condensation protein A [Actinomycetota bacterium]|jgi:segregation and condensation protein A|nr:segregation/condensation protein A [Actinomycetota bacterium]
MSGSYCVSVGAFTGPFDLLLHLIARHKVDIYEVSLARITDDYLAVVRELQRPRSSGEGTAGQLDLETATEFLLVAATLVELKAARLLPGEDDPELDELALEARDLLYARLLDYRTFKDAAAFLADGLAASAGYVARDVRLEQRYTELMPAVRLGVDAQQLAALAARVLADRPASSVDTSHLQPVRMTVREAAGMVMTELERAGGRATFREVTAGCRHRVEVIVCFLALLELYKLDLVDLEQAGSFDVLTVAVGPNSRFADSALAEMDSYDGSVKRSVPDPGQPVPDEQTPL